MAREVRLSIGRNVRPTLGSVVEPKSEYSSRRAASERLTSRTPRTELAPPTSGTNSSANSEVLCRRFSTSLVVTAPLASTLLASSRCRNSLSCRSTPAANRTLPPGSVNNGPSAFKP